MELVWPLLCVIGATLGSFHPILINLGKDENGSIPFSSVSVALCVEMTKLSISLTLGAKDILFERQTIGLPFHSVIQFAIPAILYTIVNNLVTHSLNYMDPASFQIMNNLKVITTALLYKTIINRPISQQQWISILLLFLGGTINSLAGLYKSDPSNQKEQYITVTGIYLVCIYCFASSLAGVYTEAVLKKYKRCSINVQNSALYFFGILSNGIIYLSTRDGKDESLPKQDFFHGFTVYTWLIVLSQAVNGLIISIIMKYLNNIVRLLMIGSSIILTTIWSYIIFGFNVDFYFVIAFILVMSALFLYHSGKPSNVVYKRPSKGV